jgi:hypothetical protein
VQVAEEQEVAMIVAVEALMIDEMEAMALDEMVMEIMEMAMGQTMALTAAACESSLIRGLTTIR